MARVTQTGKPRRAHPARDDGFVMVALLVSIAVAAVWMGTLLPSWRQQAIREREAELAFRGESYARAIYLYRQKTGNLPPTVDILVQQHSALVAGDIASPPLETMNDGLAHIGADRRIEGLEPAADRRVGVEGIKAQQRAQSI